MKKAAVDILRDYTGSDDGLQSLGKYSSIVLPSLSRLLGENKVIFFFLGAFMCLFLFQLDKSTVKI